MQSSGFSGALPRSMPSAPLAGARFDFLMLYGIPLAAMLVTALVLVRPDWLLQVIFLDLWLLGYHHVIATYTRTALDRASFARHWKLNVLLPLAVLAATLLTAHTGGVIVLTTIYIHWQLFHYVRQSEGISRAFASRQGDRDLPARPALRAAFYVVPLVAFLTMAATGPQEFLGFPVWVPVLPTPLLAAGWAVSAVLVGLALREVLRSAARQAVSREYAHYLLSHFAVFVLAYGVLREITLSWLLANIWHNAQYLAFVWNAHQRTFKGAPAPGALLLSTLALPRNVALYLLASMTLTLLVYVVGVELGRSALSSLTSLTPLAVAAVLYQTINFHHYIVDAIIWRRPKPVGAAAAGASTGPGPGNATA